MNFSECKIRFLNIKGEDMPDSEYYSLKGFTSISRLKLLDPRHGGSPQKYSQGFDFGYNESLLLGIKCAVWSGNRLDYYGAKTVKAEMLIPC